MQPLAQLEQQQVVARLALRIVSSKRFSIRPTRVCLEVMSLERKMGGYHGAVGGMRAHVRTSVGFTRNVRLMLAQ